MSDAFEQAWVLIKMPLVRDSIEYGKPNYSGFPTATATFQHPDDPNVQYDMEARGSQGGTQMKVFEPPTGMWDRRLAGSGYFQTGHDPNPDDTTTSDIGTEDRHRRKGVGTAMYDLINEMGKTKGVRLKTHAGNLSGDPDPLWARVLGLPYEGDDEVSAHTKFQRDNRKPFYWPEEGVYE